MKKIVDENGRLFGKISVIDIIVILVVIILAAAVYLKLNVNETTSIATPTQNVTYYLNTTNTRKEYVDALRVGDSVFDTNGNNVGTITDIKVTDALVNSTLQDGTYVTVPSAERYDITLTVDVPCMISNGRYYANRTRELNVNSLRELYTRYLGFTAIITGIE